MASQKFLPKLEAKELSSEINVQLVSEHETAMALGVKVATLRKWAVRRAGPTGRIRIGRNVFYRKDGLLRWIDSLSDRKGVRHV